MIEIENAWMGQFTTYKAGGFAKRLLEPQTEEELVDALRTLSESGEDVLLLGNGSNTLFREGGFDGTVVLIGKSFSHIKVTGNEIICGAGTLLSTVSKKALEHSLSGLEFAEGIPGSVGGGVYMNGGAYGGEMKDVVEWVRAITFDGKEILTIGKDKLDFGYRHSVFSEKNLIVLEACFGMVKAGYDEIKSKMDDYRIRRKSKQPLELPSCGSFFKRPKGYFAGKLIEDSGLRGLQVGGAQVSEKHCGFIVNHGGATAEDIISLMKIVQERVYDKFGILLEPEVRIVGRD